MRLIALLLRVTPAAADALTPEQLALVNQVVERCAQVARADDAWFDAHIARGTSNYIG